MRDVAPPLPAELPLVSVVIPCLNEAENIVQCVTRALDVLYENDISGEVIVADNGSDDGSAELATQAGATVVHEPRRGYGRAYLAGFAAARGDYIVMVDTELTYDYDFCRSSGVPCQGYVDDCRIEASVGWPPTHNRPTGA